MLSSTKITIYYAKKNNITEDNAKDILVKLQGEELKNIIVEYETKMQEKLNKIIEKIGLKNINFNKLYDWMRGPYQTLGVITPLNLKIERYKNGSEEIPEKYSEEWFGLIEYLDDIIDNYPLKGEEIKKPLNYKKSIGRDT